MPFTYEKKKWIIVAVWLLIAVLSFTVAAKYASAPEHHKEVISSLDEKKDTVLELTVAATATSALITLLPGDVATPIAEKIADLSGYLMIVLCAIFLEKYLVTITGYAAFRIFIPLACLLFAGNKFFENDSIRCLARKLLVFGICIFLVVPSSVKLADLIDDTYHTQIDLTLDEARKTQKILESQSESDTTAVQPEQNTKTEQKQQKEGSGNLWEMAKGALNSAKESVTSAVENVTLSTEELLQKAEHSLSRFVEAVAVMLITSCVIPLLVLVVFVWLIKILVNVDLSRKMTAISDLRKRSGEK